MGRLFTAASSDRIQVGSAGLNGFNFLYGTFAVCTYIVGSATFDCYYASNGGTHELLTSSGKMAWWDNVSEADGATNVATGAQMILVWAKNSGANLPRFHQYRFATGAWVHENGNHSEVDAATVTSVTLGAFTDAAASDALDSEVFAMAAWNKVVFSDSEVERLPRGNWLNLAPDFYEQWSDGREVGDMTRTLGRYPMRQTGRTGTTRGAQKPPPGFRMDARRHRR